MLFSKTGEIQLSLRYAKTDSDIDRFGGPGGDDPNFTSKFNQLNMGVGASERFFSERLKSSLNLSYVATERSNRNDSDSVDTSQSKDVFDGLTTKISLENDLSLGESSTLRLNAHWLNAVGSSEGSLDGVITKIDKKERPNYGVSMIYLFDDDVNFFDFGGRIDYGAGIGSIPNHRLSLGRRFNNKATKLYISYGTGYKLPSLYQIHSMYGNKELKHEYSRALELTIEQRLSEVAMLTVTAFDNEYTNYIDWSANPTPGRYYNISSAASSGIELQGTTKVSDFITLSGSYTYLKATDGDSGQRLIRRPHNSYVLAAQYEKNRLDFNAQYLYRGSRLDVDPISYSRNKAASYSILNLGGGFKVNQNLKLYARLENFLDKDYEEIAGYGVQGRSIFFGLSGQF